MCVCVPQHMYVCRKTNSAVSPCLSPCLRQGLRDVLSVATVDLQTSGKAGLLSVFVAVGWWMPTNLSIYMGFVDPNSRTHPCSKNAANLPNPRDLIFQNFQPIFQPSTESQSDWLWKGLSSYPGSIKVLIA